MDDGLADRKVSAMISLSWVASPRNNVRGFIHGNCRVSMGPRDHVREMICPALTMNQEIIGSNAAFVDCIKTYL